MTFDSYTVSILESEVGELKFLRQALQILGCAFNAIETAADIEQAHLIVFASGGSIDCVMKALSKRNLVSSLKDYLLQDRPYLGVGSGMHLLFEGSDDHSDTELLGLISGTVSKLESWDVCVPHIGWNGVSAVDSSLSSLGASNVASTYFAHSHCVAPCTENMEFIRSITDHGDQRFISTVSKGRITGVQFHPELSGMAGLNFLREYLSQFAATNESVATSANPVVLEDFGELQALPGTVATCRVAAVARAHRDAMQLYLDGADEVVIVDDVANTEGVFVPISRYSPSNAEFEVADRHLKNGTSRIIVNVAEVARIAADFLTTGMATGESVMERLSRKYGSHAVVVEIDAQRVLMENPMRPIQRTEQIHAQADSADQSTVDDCRYDDAFPTLGEAHSASATSNAASSTVGSEDGLVQIVAELDEEHEMLGMLRGMGRTVVHLEQELAETYEATQRAIEDGSSDASCAELPRFTHCAFSVPVLSGTQAGKRIDAVVLAKVCEVLGAGEILLRGNSGHAFDVAMINAVHNAVNISVMAAPATNVRVTLDDYSRVFERTRTKAVLLDQGEILVEDLKVYLRSVDVTIRE